MIWQGDSSFSGLITLQKRGHECCVSLYRSTKIWDMYLVSKTSDQNDSWDLTFLNSATIFQISVDLGGGDTVTATASSLISFRNYFTAIYIASLNSPPLLLANVPSLKVHDFQNTICRNRVFLRLDVGASGFDPEETITVTIQTAQPTSSPSSAPTLSPTKSQVPSQAPSLPVYSDCYMCPSVSCLCFE